MGVPFVSSEGVRAVSRPDIVGRIWRTGCLLAVLIAPAVTGCGAVDQSSGQVQPSLSHSAPASSPAAADGDDPEACADGNCEIVVSEPVTIHFEIAGAPATLSLTKVGRNEVGYKVTSGANRTSGEANGDGWGCVAVLTRTGSSSSCGTSAARPPAGQDGAVVLQVVAGADGTATLRLVSA